MADEPVFVFEVHGRKVNMAWPCVRGMLQDPEHVEGRQSALKSLHDDIQASLHDVGQSETYVQKSHDIFAEVEVMQAEAWLDGLIIATKAGKFNELRASESSIRNLHVRVEAALRNMTEDGIAQVDRKRFDAIVEANMKLAKLLNANVAASAALGSS